jgi:prolyl oligopeptidase
MPELRPRPGLFAYLTSAALLVALSACDGGYPPAATPGSPKPAVTASPFPSASAAAPALARPDYGYPAARRVDVRETIHGVSVADPYRWLEDGDSDEVHAWMKAEDGFTRAKLAKLPGRDAFAARLSELFYVESMGIPRRFGTRWFFSRRAATAEKSAVYWRQGKNGPEKVLLDPNAWSADGSKSLGAWSVSWDGKKVAYNVRANNSDEATLHVLDVATGKESSVDVIEGAKYARAQWTRQSDGFYYTWLPVGADIPVAERPGYAEIRFHQLGSDPKKDPMVHERTGDAKTFLATQLGKHGRWLFASIEHGWSATDVFFQDLREKPAARKWTKLADGKDGIFAVEAHKDRFYVLTNSGAPTWRMFRVDPAQVERDKWQEIVPARADATLTGFTIVGGKLALQYLKDVVAHLELSALDGRLLREIALPGLGSTSAVVGDPDDDLAYYSYESFTQPPTIFETRLGSGATKQYFQPKVPIDATKFVVEQEKFRSKDGTTVPMFVIHAKDRQKDGAAPTILYGYGGFQIAETPSFSSSIFPWIEKGGVYAVANLRGGDEYGEKWHEAGMRHNKQNVFDDFIAAAEDLIRLHWTSKDELVVRGGSNGGLLVGAALTERPDLFRAVLCGVPLIDMVRFHKFGSGKTWIEEYGSAEDAADFKALYAYSPYHHVVRGTKYPAVLVLSADSDDRVDPMHARKFTAALQNASTGGIVLLRIEKHSGHGGADLVKASVEKIADEYAFAWSEVGGK